MSNIVQARVEICGKRPLLQHQFGPEALPLAMGERTGVAGNEPDEWKRTCMVASKGQLYVRGSYIFGMLRGAARHTKKGKGSIQALMAATLLVDEEQILLDRWMPKGGPVVDPTQPVYIDVCGVRNPATKARNVRYRLAASAGWKATFTVLWDKTIISRDQMKAVLNDAGTLVGLADWPGGCVGGGGVFFFFFFFFAGRILDGG